MNAIAAVLTAAFASSMARAERLDLPALYPSPLGIYRELATTDRTVLARDEGAVGIGIETPTHALTVRGPGANGVLLRAAGDSVFGSAAQAVFRRSRGTASSPAAAAAGDELGAIRAFGYDGSYAAPAAGGAALRFSIDGPVAPGFIGGRIDIDAGPGGGAIPRLTIRSNGYVGIGIEDPRMPVDLGPRGTLVASRIHHPDSSSIRPVGNMLYLYAEDESASLGLYGPNGIDGNGARHSNEASYRAANVLSLRGSDAGGAALDNAVVSVNGRVWAGLSQAFSTDPSPVPWTMTVEGSLCADDPGGGGSCPVDAPGISADRNIIAPGFDLAERFLPAGPVEPGDVVMAGDRFGTVVRAEGAYTRRVIGVASERPGVILGKPEEGVPIAVMGRLSVKVSAEGGPIEIGDLLVASSQPGVAMKAARAAPGAIIGKALERHPKGSGRIIVYVTAR